MADDTLNQLADYEIVPKGGLIWQNRLPGGICIYMGIVTKETTRHNPEFWTERDEPVYSILHPEEGLIEDTSYYYCTLEDEEKYAKVRLRYELKQAGHPVPDWLHKAIEEDERR